ncbi:MAG TPA: hypothetical protein VJY12_10590, partial [Dysgonamonadaceae bacterium]|nr:hypothetical protein [Dysgonamonadaceae bacterium]
MDLNNIIQLQKSRMSAGRNNFVNGLEDVTFSNFEQNPAYKVVGFQGEEVGVHFIDNGTTQVMPSRYTICKPPFEFSVGDIITSDGITWICTSVNSVQYNKSFFIPCNLKLKFIDNDNKLIEKDCRVSGQTLYTTGIKDEKVIEIPNGMMGVQMPYDKDTKKLDRKQGFIFNKTKYEITFYNDVEHPGLIVLICSESLLSERKDDMVNQIADRWVEIDGGGRVDRLPWLDDIVPPVDPPIEPEPDPTVGISYEITVEKKYSDDNDFEIWYNNWQKYHIKKLENDIEVEGNFAYELSDSKATIDEAKPNSCVVKVGGISG